MFCAQCGQPNGDTSAFCANCGSPLKPSIPTQPQSSQIPVIPMQSQYNSPVPPKKTRKGLVLGLIAGVLLFFVAAALLVFLWLIPSISSGAADSGKSIIGIWSCEENADVLKFKENDSVYMYNADGHIKGTYEFDKNKSKGVITLDNSDYDFSVDKDELNVEDMGVYVKEDAKDFDVDSFIKDNTPMTEATETTVKPTAVTSSTTSAVESVTDKEMTLSFYFGDRTGTYTGDFADGLPNGYGSFTSADTDGVVWVYEGDWVDGHFNGKGTTTWDSGYVETGEYRDDYINGIGQESFEGVIYYEGAMTDATPNGIGTIYNSHSEEIYSGNFVYGYIQESKDDRSARIGAFKDQSVSPTYAELYQACSDQTSLRSQITGKVFQVFEYEDNEQYYCDFLMYEQGIEESGRVIEVYYRLSEGEAKCIEGQSVTVWGTTEYLYTYDSNNGDTLTVPHIEAFSVE